MTVMNNHYDKSSILTSLMWKLMERFGAQGAQFIVTVILARLLSPRDFGVISLISIFIVLANTLISSGFNTALIQKKNVDDLDLSSIFYLSLVVSGFINVILLFAAPFIAHFFKEQQLTILIRVLSFTLYLGALNSIQNAIVARKMQFKKLFFSSLGGTIVSGAIGIGLAYDSYGVWALVYQQISGQIIISIILWFSVKWRPRLIFSLKRVKKLFPYASKMLISSVIDVMYTNIRIVVIGRLYSPAILGFYNRGMQIPSLIVSNLDGSIQSVMFPALSSQQDDRLKVKIMVRRSIITSSFFVFPMMAGLAVIAKPLVYVLFTVKWLPAVPFLEIACVSSAFLPIHTANLQAISAMGRSDIFLRLELLKKTIGVCILIVSMFFGVYAVAFGAVISGAISTFINAYPNLKLLDYSYKEQWKDIMPSFVTALVMGTVVYSIQYFGFTPIITLAIQVVLGLVLYVVLARISKLEIFIYILSTAKELVRHNRMKSRS